MGRTKRPIGLVQPCLQILLGQWVAGAAGAVVIILIVLVLFRRRPSK